MKLFYNELIAKKEKEKLCVCQQQIKRFIVKKLYDSEVSASSGFIAHKKCTTCFTKMPNRNRWD